MKHDYQKDAVKLDQHLDNTLKTQTYRMADVSHLGGAAALLNYLNGKHYGETHAIKKELKRVIDYLYMYTSTGHEIYMFLAEDAFMHVEQLQAAISDPAEQLLAADFLDKVREYMGWLKAENTGTTFAARQPHTPAPGSSMNL